MLRINLISMYFLSETRGLVPLCGSIFAHLTLPRSHQEITKCATSVNNCHNTIPNQNLTAINNSMFLNFIANFRATDSLVKLPL